MDLILDVKNVGLLNSFIVVIVIQKYSVFHNNLFEFLVDEMLR